MPKSRFTLASTLGSLHDRLIYQRRVHAIADLMKYLLPSGRMLDVGCGNGDLARTIMILRPDIEVVGLDVMIRTQSKIPTIYYDGGTFPFADNTFESVLLADTLHHIADQVFVLKESLRVSCGSVFIKDHFYRGALDHLLLRLLDIGGNAPHAVPSIFNYFTRERWQSTLEIIDAEEHYRREEVPGQYPAPFQVLLGKDIQFVAEIASRSSQVSSGTGAG